MKITHFKHYFFFYSFLHIYNQIQETDQIKNSNPLIESKLVNLTFEAIVMPRSRLMESMARSGGIATNPPFRLTEMAEFLVFVVVVSSY